MGVIAAQLDLKDSDCFDTLLALVDSNQVTISRIAEEYEQVLSIVINSIYCLTEIIDIYHSSGISFLTNNTALGDYYRKLGDWLVRFELLKLIFRDHYSILDVDYVKNMFCSKSPQKKISLDPVDRLSMLCDYELVSRLKPISQYHLAVKYYFEAIQMHQVRKSYSTQIVNTYYLEDDFNDNLFHFGISIERYKINSGYNRALIESLKKGELENTPLKNIRYFS